VAGSLVAAGCAPSRPVSVFELHGTADAHVGYGGSGLAHFLPVQDVMHGWAKQLACPGANESWPQGEREVWLQKGGARCERHLGCRGDAEVALCRLEGAGHNWPGGPEVDGLGKTSFDVDATQEIWRFFERHRR
jgi:polyhydroxybutyrate depolymerase